MERDPGGGLAAFADMVEKGILMPAHYMDDGAHAANNGGRTLFADYAGVAERVGVYTAVDYADILDHLVARWGIEGLTGLNGEEYRRQEFLIKHSQVRPSRECEEEKVYLS